jgi:hypothetical protein
LKKEHLQTKKYNLKVLRAKYPDYDDIFIEDDKPTNEIKPITINQTINIISSTISIMNIEKTAKVKTNKSKFFDLFDSDEE